MNFSLPNFALRHPITIMMIFVSSITMGMIAWYKMPLKFLPDMEFPFIGCYIPYPGATPEQVEKEVAIPAEGEFRTIPHIKTISSSSDSNGCYVSMLFNWGTDMGQASAEGPRSHGTSQARVA